MNFPAHYREKRSCYAELTAPRPALNKRPGEFDRGRERCGK